MIMILLMLSESVILLIITSITTIVMGLIGLRQIKLNKTVEKVVEKIEDNTKITKDVKIKLNEVGENVDGKIDKLLVATGAAKKAEGKEEGRQQMKDEIVNGVIKVEIVENKKDDKPTPE